MDFDFQNFNEEDFNDLIPAGKYRLMITKVEQKESKKGGWYLNLHIQVIDGERSGYVMYEILSLGHESEKVVNIAKSKLKKIVGVTTDNGNIDSFEDIKNQPFIGEVVIQSDKNGVYDDKNVVKKFYKDGSSAPTTASGDSVADAMFKV